MGFCSNSASDEPSGLRPISTCLGYLVCTVETKVVSALWCCLADDYCHTGSGLRQTLCELLFITFHIAGAFMSLFEVYSLVEEK